MCRFVAYLGQKILLEEVLVKPVNSIIRQSLQARETSFPTNGDGFGLGWYAPSISSEPALFTSISPAWNDRNLLNLTAKIKAPCFFAHVRAAGTGSVSTYNCHPFVHGPWMLMHNGDIDDFMLVKRHLRRLLDDDIYNWIKGETDSEHLFALFLQLAKGKDLKKLSVIAEILYSTFDTINQLVKDFGHHNSSFFNVCLTDGHRLIASRYTNDKNHLPESLHFFRGPCFKPQGSAEGESSNKNTTQSVVIASEKLTDLNNDWLDVPVNRLLLVDSDHTIQIM